MILQCPECSTRFLVSDALIPADGRVVRCGKCKHDWHVMPHAVPMEGMQPEERSADTSDVFASFDSALDSASSDDIDALAHSAMGDAQLPAIHAATFRAKPFIWATAALAALALIIAPLAYYPAFGGGGIFTPIYSMLGWKATDGIAFADVNMTREKSDAKTRFIIAGNLVNQSEQTRTVPVVRIALNDKEGEAIWSREYEVNKTLRAGDIYPFRITNVETTFGDKVSSIWVDVGNGYELMVR